MRLPSAVDADLDTLAGELRERLLAAAGEPDGGEGAQERIRALVDRDAGVLDAEARARLVDRIAERAFGLGPLEPLLRDPGVEEVMVSGTAPVWVERGGRLERTEVRFAREADLREAIERILVPLGRRVDEAEPLCDARLPDQCAGARQSFSDLLPGSIVRSRFRRLVISSGRSTAMSGSVASGIAAGELHQPGRAASGA